MADLTLDEQDPPDDENGTFELELPGTVPPRDPLTFSGSIALNLLIPNAGIPAPILCQVKLTPHKVPIVMVFETPDPVFLKDFAKALLDHAETMLKHPYNDKYIGQHDNIDPDIFDAELRAAVAASQAGTVSNPEDASSEKGN